MEKIGTILRGIMGLLLLLSFLNLCLVPAMGTPELVAYSDDIDNQPPENLSVTGESYGYAGTEYPFYANATDPDGDQLYYKFDWDDGSFSDWIGPYDSGIPIPDSHAWTSGSYNIRIKAKDVNGAESDWSVPFNFEVRTNSIYTMHPWICRGYPLITRILSLFH